MCGIFGYLASRPPDNSLINRIHALQHHRGPDDTGHWSGKFADLSLTFAFQRLAIIDLTPNGAQPFHSASESVLVYNGEIYNYIELRNELKSLGVPFRTESDTEVLLAALEHYGIEGTLARLNGMFAFAWLCGRTGRLWVARDRVGEKPLYYWQDEQTFAFASEIKSLLAVAETSKFSPNYAVIHDFLISGITDHSAATFFSGIRMLGPGQYAEIARANGVQLKPRSYWPAKAISERTGSLDSHAEELTTLLEDAVRLRLRSDVPLGFLVSGGLDSSILTALAIKQGVQRERLTAFSLVNPDVPADESRWIDSVTSHLGIKVNKVLFDPDGAALLQALDEQVFVHDEPFIDLPVIAHVAMTKAARDCGITVLLSGQGGDELFCGYNKYFYFAIQELLRSGHPWRALQFAHAFWRSGTVLAQFSARDAARYTRLPLPGVASLPLGPHLAGAGRANIGLQVGTNVRDRQLSDLLRFSAPAITHAEDRASMAMSREVRFPFLDHRLMEFALSLPLEQKIGEGWTKRIVRLIGQPVLPPEIVWRKDKTGHFTASADWLIGRAGHIVRDRIAKCSPVFDYGILDPDKMLPQWRDFWNGKRSGLNVRHVVSILTLDSWFRSFSQSLRH